MIFTSLIMWLTVGVAEAGKINDANDLVGTWNVTLSTELSGCEALAKQGDTLAQQWVVSSREGTLSVQVLGVRATGVGYTGIVEDGRVTLVSAGLSTGSTVELFGSDDQLTGQRIVAQAGPPPCAILYNVKAKKQR